MAGVFLMNSYQPGVKNNQEVRKKKEPEGLGQIGALPDTCRYPADNPPTKEKS